MSRRYLQITIRSKSSVTEEQFSQALNASIIRYFGEIGLSRIAPKLIRFDSRKSNAVVAFAKDHTVEMQAALAFISQVGESETVMLPLKTSGTIKGLGKS
ncbi:MAG TPA: Rpp14/Pop5 family protein [Methylomirabilota bacterium]|nr:Rpp14/Pop5 family protein [Methylomirabilota bacterium]